MKTATFTMIGVMSMSLATACSEAVPKQLADARSAYRSAAEGPAKQLNPAQLMEAERSLKLAERTYDAEGENTKARDRAYIAMRKAQLADIQARTMAATQEEQKWRAQVEAAEQRAFARANDQLSNVQSQLSGVESRLEAERSQRQQAEEQTRQTREMLQQIAAVKEDQRGTVITLSGAVLFRSGETDLTGMAGKKLGQVARALKANASEQRILVEGHSDAQGSAEFNRKLSQDRAESVRSFLVSRGLSANRVEAVGKGEDEPIASNDSAEGRANNRRVEIVLQPVQSGSGAQQRSGDTAPPGS